MNVLHNTLLIEEVQKNILGKKYLVAPPPYWKAWLIDVL